MSASQPFEHIEPDDPRVSQLREKIARFGRTLYERRLTDGAGGNISARLGDIVCITPRFAGSKRQWQIEGNDVLVANLQGQLLAGSGEISREAKVHFRLLNDFGQFGTSVIHCHARNVLVFAAQARPIPPVLESTRKFGVIPVSEFAPAHSNHLAEYVANAIAPNQHRIQKQAAAAVAPYHGLFVIGKDLDAALDAAERIDNNAYCILMGAALSGGDSLSAERARMESSIKAYDLKHPE